jgi:hypothetical protein
VLPSSSSSSSSSCSCSSGATTELSESFDLLKYFLPFHPILDALGPVINFHNSYIFFYIVFPYNFGFPANLVSVSTHTIYRPSYLLSFGVHGQPV